METEEVKKLFPVESFKFDQRPLSYSTLKHILKTPLHFADNWHYAKERKKSDELFFGSLMDDMLFLDKKEFEEKYVVKPKFEGTGARTREAEWKQLNQSKQFATKADLQQAKLMCEALKANPMSAKLYEATTVVQKKIEWEDKKTGLKFVVKLDSLAEIDGKPVIWDLKTAADASNEQYQRDAAKWYYTLQAHMYSSACIRKGYGFPPFYHVVCEKTEPYAVNVFQADKTFMEVGKAQFERACERILYCKEKDCFDQGYEFLNEKGYNILSVPVYEKQKWIE